MAKKNDNENDNDEEDEDEDDDSDDYTSDDDDESDDEIMSYLKQKHLEEAENEMKTNKGISDKSDTISLEKHNELQNIKMSTYYLDRIKLYDKNVTGNNYAYKCQASNQSQPIIITDEKKKAIDTIEGKKGKDYSSYDKFLIQDMEIKIINIGIYVLSLGVLTAKLVHNPKY